jgi:hypothetical protein
MTINALIRGPAVLGQQAVAYPQSAGDVIYNRFTVNVPAGTVVGNCLEIGVIPPNCRVLDMVLENSALGAGVTCGVGWIAPATIPPGSTDLANRTCGTEFFPAATAIAAAGAARMAQASGFQVAPDPRERGIGVTLAGATTVASVQSVTLGVWLAA